MSEPEGSPTARLVKQVIIIRRDLKMRRGKEIAQGSHASCAWLAHRVMEGKAVAESAGSKVRRLEGPLGSDDYVVMDLVAFTPAEWEWLAGNFRKVTCQASSEEELLTIYEAAKAASLQAHLTYDDGLTELSGVKTLTCLAIGPDLDDRVDLVTGKLRLY